MYYYLGKRLRYPSKWLSWKICIPVFPDELKSSEVSPTFKKEEVKIGKNIDLFIISARQTFSQECKFIQNFVTISTIPLWFYEKS